MFSVPRRHVRTAIFLVSVAATFVFFDDLNVWIYGYGGRDAKAMRISGAGVSDMDVTSTASPSPSGESAGGGVNLTYSIKPVEVDPWDPSNYVVGPVTSSFRDNLRNDTSYITTWTDGGFTNEFMTYVNMVYLGTISNRVPVLPPFAPLDHIRKEAGIVPFGAVFDLARFRRTLRLPILEWSDIKDLSSPSSSSSLPPPAASSNPEPIGCWSAWATGNLRKNEPRRPFLEPLTTHLSLDISYTAVPQYTRRLLGKEGEWDTHLLFWPLASIIFPTPSGVPLNSVAGLYKGPAEFASKSGHRLPPDGHLACFDFLYFVIAATEEYEWNYSWSPAWRYVGQHLRFEERLLELGKTYARKAFGLQEGSEVPSFIAVHVRHGDFGRECEKGKTITHCVGPLSVYARHISEVQKELLERQGIDIPDHHVLLTSDETNTAFWSEATTRGWRYINHTAEQTTETHGEWYPTLVDIVVQSLASGFVGTADSTVSIVSKRRVEDWNRGVTRMVRLQY